MKHVCYLRYKILFIIKICILYFYSNAIKQWLQEMIYWQRKFEGLITNSLLVAKMLVMYDFSISVIKFILTALIEYFIFQA